MKRLFFILVAASIVATAGCHSSAKKRSDRVAAGVEEEFKQRWVAQRMGELTSGKPPMEAREARRQAVNEFRLRFSHTDAARNADPVGDGTLP